LELLKIDDVSKECGLTKRTIRYYEEIGLIPPPERSEGGIRLYTRGHIERLKQIINARDVLGFTLQEIQQFVSVGEQLELHRKGYRETVDENQKMLKLTEIEPILRQQLQMIDDKMERMADFRKDIEHLHTRVRNAIEAKQNKKE